MRFGYRGSVLEVELDQRDSRVTDLPEEDAGRFIGGSGLNAWLLYQSLRPSTRATDPDNPLVFGAGPLVGTSFPTSARSTFTALSPLTGVFGDSNGGGLFGVQVKRAGYDHMVIRGASDRPCYLTVAPNGNCKIEDASDLWGEDTLETERILKKKYPKAVVASIGPAGENLVRYASIQFERNAHSFSRAGMGAVMGSKNLKAIVVHGGGGIPVKNPEETGRISEAIKQAAKECAFPKLFTRYGTPMFINLLESLGLVYGENWRRRIEHSDITSLDIAAFHDAAESKSHGCYRCPLRCGKHWRIRQGPHAGEEGFKYEVAFIMTLGMSLGLRDVPSILHIVNKLNRMGIDVNEFAGTLGMATDAYQKGVLSRDATDGFSFDWGNAEAYASIIDWISERRGFGGILAEGTKRAAVEIGGGAEDYALHMKGMHWPAHSAPPFVLAFSLSTRGGDFLKAMPYLLMQSTNKEVCRKLFGASSETMDIYSHEAKGRAVWWHENYKLLLDSLGVCFYLGLSLLPHGRLLPEELAVAYRGVTGIDVDGKTLLKAAESSNQIQRAINACQGMDRKNDAFTRRPEQDSWAQGIDLDLPGMLDEYYAYRGLSRTGLPTTERLRSAGLQDLAVDLGEKGLLDCCLEADEDCFPDSIIKNPKPEDLGRSIKARIQDKVRKRVMAKLSEDPLTYREHFRKQGCKRRKRRKNRNG